MNIMQKKVIYFIGIAVICLSCHKELNEDARSQVTDNYLSTPEGFESGVNAAYSFLRNYYGNAAGTFLTEAGTDTYTIAIGGDRDFNNYSPNLGPTKSLITSTWNNFYIAINACNAVISRGPGIPGLDEELRNRRVAEARFLRGLYYFILVQTFGPVHLSLEETQGVVTTAQRAPLATIYEAIVADLSYAVDNLLPVADQYGRATKPAAQHLLAKVYLTRGWSEAKAPDDFANAALLAEQVINDSKHQLLEDFASVFAIGTGEQNDEVIFSVQYGQNVLTNGAGNQTHLHFVPKYDILPGMKRDVELGRPFSYLRPTDFSLNELYKLGPDAREEKTFIRLYRTNNPGTYTIHGRQVTLQMGDTAIFFPKTELTPEEVLATNYSVFPPSKVDEGNFPTLRKHLDPNRPDLNYEAGSRDFIVMRLAETYLIAAEAYLMAGQPEKALPFINAVRRRAAAWGKNPEETASNKVAMEVGVSDLSIDFILDERGRELSGECLRWFDLTRTGKLLERVKAHNELAAANIKEYHVLRPIPQSQIDRTDGGNAAFPQNEGYQ